METPVGSLDFKCWKEVPIAELNQRKFSIYIIDYNWNYLFVNEAAKKNLNGIELEGRNIKDVWTSFPHLNFESVYNQLKDHVNNRESFTLRSTSPITNKSIEVVGRPLSDSYYFSITELPDKEALLSELRAFIRRQK